MDSQLQPITSPETPKTNILVWLVGGIVILGVGIGIGLFLAKNIYPPLQILPAPTPSPIATVDPTANWKTYANISYKYSLKYPSDWKITTESGADPSSFPAPYFDSPCAGKTEPCSQILITTRAGLIKDLEPDFIINQTGSNPDIVSNKKEGMVGGEKASLFEYFQSNYSADWDSSNREYLKKGRLLYVVVVVHNDTKYTITYEETQKNIIRTGKDWKAKDVFDQILSTFRFVDQATPKPTCKPRPACLDTNPRCLLPETSDMCPPNQKL